MRCKYRQSTFKSLVSSDLDVERARQEYGLEDSGFSMMYIYIHVGMPRVHHLCNSHLKKHPCKLLRLGFQFFSLRFRRNGQKVEQPKIRMIMQSPQIVAPPCNKQIRIASWSVQFLCVLELASSNRWQNEGGLSSSF